MKKIDLACTEIVPSLIIEFPSGILWSNQTWGVMCNHPEVEGVFVPLTHWGSKDMLDEITGEYPVEEKIVDWIEKFKLPLKMVKIDDSLEAWIRVEILPHDDKYSPLRDFVGFKAILTYENSD